MLFSITNNAKNFKEKNININSNNKITSRLMVGARKRAGYMILTRKVAALSVTFLLCLAHVFLVHVFLCSCNFLYLLFLVYVVLVYLNVQYSKSLPYCHLVFCPWRSWLTSHRTLFQLLFILLNFRSFASLPSVIWKHNIKIWRISITENNFARQNKMKKEIGESKSIQF